MPRSIRGKWILAASLALCAGVGVYYLDLLKAAVAPNPIPRSSQSISRGRQLFHRYCEVCHGPEAHGDGPASASLPEHPEDLTRIAPPPYFPDGVVAYRIANGQQSMPAWKDVLSADEIWDLINFIRSLHRESRCDPA
jgi:mono/diheme cytochrome c family protein